MRVLLLSLICICTYTQSRAQAFLGMYATDNYANQVRDNPAYAIHEDRMQLNFCGAAVEIGGNSILYKKSIANFLFTGKAAMDKDYFRNQNDQPDKCFWANIELMGPGASVLIKKKYFVAVNTGMRYLVNADNLSNRVFNLLGVNPVIDSNVFDSFTVKNFSLTGQVFNEYDFTYAGFFYESEEYKWEGGVTLKVLNGIAAAGMGIPDASFKTYKHDGVAYGTDGTANIAYTPFANKWALTNSPLRALKAATNNMGLGLDLGMVYYINPNEGFTLKRGYTTRFAASITDIGSINYTAGSATGSYSVNNANINYRGINNNEALAYGNRIFNEYLVDTLAKVKSLSKKFRVGLPTALHLNADFKVQPRIFVNANALINLRQPSADKYANHYITTVTVTPRYIIKNFSVSLPFSFNSKKQGYLGAIVYVGPFYIGSGSLFQIAASNSINNLNLFLGANLRVKPKKQKEKDMMMM